MLKLPEIRKFTGESPSSWYAKIAAGMAPRPVQIGPRATGWPREEIEKFVAVRNGGASADQLRKFVCHLHCERERAARRILDELEA